MKAGDIVTIKGQAYLVVSVWDGCVSADDWRRNVKRCVTLEAHFEVPIHEPEEGGED
ncbi:MAG: hypothetical protein KAJ01_02695 [Candidatus Hydrogenedentes bacterium]|nr:hypothetical protein [Candidatus Hydrogenedentota bacterium]